MVDTTETGLNPEQMVHNPVSFVISVKESLLRLSKSKDLETYIVESRTMWAVFGKMNSHLYRAILMKRMAEANLDPESQFMVFFLHSVIKNRDRILKSMDAMSPAEQAQKWFNPVKTFISTHVTQYVSDVVRSKKFPAVNIPSCNPGLDILVYCLITDPNERTLVELFNRPTASQLLLDSTAQEEAKIGYKYYWDTVVRGTKNPDAKLPNSQLEVPKFREEFYDNQAGDQYMLVDLNLKEVPPLNASRGYSLEELRNYLKSVDPKQEYKDETSALTLEKAKMVVESGAEGGVVVSAET